jgi:hypothetical protein
MLIEKFSLSDLKSAYFVTMGKVGIEDPSEITLPNNARKETVISSFISRIYNHRCMMYDYTENAFWWVYVRNFSDLESYPETPSLDHLNRIHSWWYSLKLGIPDIFLILKNFPCLYFYRTFSKRLTVEKVKELVKSDHFKYVVVLTREDLYLGFSLLEKAERRCIFEIILSGGDTGDHIVGWLV